MTKCWMPECECETERGVPILVRQPPEQMRVAWLCANCHVNQGGDPAVVVNIAEVESKMAENARNKSP